MWKEENWNSKIFFLGIYFNVNLILVLISVVLTVVVLNFHYRGPKKSRVPRWCRRLVMGKIGHWLGFHFIETGVRYSGLHWFDTLWGEPAAHRLCQHWYESYNTSHHRTHQWSTVTALQSNVLTTSHWLRSSAPIKQRCTILWRDVTDRNLSAVLSIGGWNQWLDSFL